MIQTLGGAQIDLVIKRGDRVVNLCEMKFADVATRTVEPGVDVVRVEMKSEKADETVVNGIEIEKVK